MLFAACFLLFASLDRDKRGQEANSKKREAKISHDSEFDSGEISSHFQTLIRINYQLQFIRYILRFSKTNFKNLPIACIFTSTTENTITF